MKIKDISKDSIEYAIRNSKSFFSTLKFLGVTCNEYNMRFLKDFIVRNGTNTEHFNIRLTKDDYYNRPKHCKFCNKIIPYEKRNNDFCSHSCAASFNNLGVQRNINIDKFNVCPNCGKKT